MALIFSAVQLQVDGLVTLLFSKKRNTEFCMRLLNTDEFCLPLVRITLIFRALFLLMCYPGC